VCPDGRRRVRSARRDAIGTDALRTTRRSRRDGPRSTAPDSRSTRRAPRRSRRRRGADIDKRSSSHDRAVSQSFCAAVFRAFSRLPHLFAFLLAASK
jgi:hypothetical protein